MKAIEYRTKFVVSLDMLHVKGVLEAEGMEGWILCACSVPFPRPGLTLVFYRPKEKKKGKKS